MGTTICESATQVDDQRGKRRQPLSGAQRIVPKSNSIRDHRLDWPGSSSAYGSLNTLFTVNPRISFQEPLTPVHPSDHPLSGAIALSQRMCIGIWTLEHPEYAL